VHFVPFRGNSCFSPRLRASAVKQIKPNQTIFTTWMREGHAANRKKSA
jgi:hypothetical protein